jgi:hypothetical protein
MSTTTVVETSTQYAGDIQLHSLEEATSPTPTPAPVPQDDLLVLNKKNTLKLVAAGFSFFFAGTNDGSLGALTPYILRTYNIGTDHVALM